MIDSRSARKARNIVTAAAGIGAALVCVLQCAAGVAAAERRAVNAATPQALRGRAVSQRVRTWIEPRFGRALATGTQPVVYISQSRYGTVLAYPTGTATPPTSPIETISGLNGPSALAVDLQGNLYVLEAAAVDIQVFAPGSLTPFRTLTPLAGSADYVSIAVDSHATVYALTAPGKVDVYRSGATAPSMTLSDPAVVDPSSIAVDGAGNVYVSMPRPTGPVVGVFVAATSVGFGAFHILTLAAPTRGFDVSSGALAIDKNGELLVGNDLTSPSIGVYSAAKQVPAALTPIPGPAGFFALTAGNHHLYVSRGTKSDILYECAFPGGQIQQQIVLPVLVTDGIATSPASPQGVW